MADGNDLLKKVISSRVKHLLPLIVKVTLLTRQCGTLLISAISPGVIPAV